MEHHRKDTKPFQIRVEETVKKLEALHKPRNRLTMRKICKLFFVLSVCITLGIAMLLLLLYVWYCFESWYPGVKLLMLEPCKDCKNQFQQKSHKKPSLGTVLYKFFKGFVKEVPVYSWWICWYLWWCETMAVLSKNRTFIFFLTFLLLMPNVT